MQLRHDENGSIIPDPRFLPRMPVDASDEVLGHIYRIAQARTLMEAARDGDAVALSMLRDAGLSAG